MAEDSEEDTGASTRVFVLLRNGEVVGVFESHLAAQQGATRFTFWTVLEIKAMEIER